MAAQAADEAAGEGVGVVEDGAQAFDLKTQIGSCGSLQPGAGEAAVRRRARDLEALTGREGVRARPARPAAREDEAIERAGEDEEAHLLRRGAKRFAEAGADVARERGVGREMVDKPERDGEEPMAQRALGRLAVRREERGEAEAVHRCALV